MYGKFIGDTLQAVRFRQSGFTVLGSYRGPNFKGSVLGKVCLYNRSLTLMGVNSLQMNFPEVAKVQSSLFWGKMCAETNLWVKNLDEIIPL